MFQTFDMQKRQKQSEVKKSKQGLDPFMQIEEGDEDSGCLSDEDYEADDMLDGGLHLMQQKLGEMKGFSGVNKRSASPCP